MITINTITVRLGGRTILDRASAAIPPGGRVGLIGRNGAGKSTLMKVLVGQLDPDDGSIEMPRRTRLGYIAQEAPNGSISPFEAVLVGRRRARAAARRSRALHRPHRLGDIHDRLLAIDAYTAPSRAAIILTGLGFDEDMQAQPLDSFSGGWKMRVRWRRCCSPRPTCCCSTSRRTTSTSNRRCGWRTSSRPTRHADRDQPRARPAQQRGRHDPPPAGRQAHALSRRLRRVRNAAGRARRHSLRRPRPPGCPAARLQDYVARNSARASTAKQAQSRAKMLAKMQPIAALMEDPSLSFDFPQPRRDAAAAHHLDLAAVGYDGNPILRRLNLRIDPDDRIALLGRNGNGKTTLARLLAAQLSPLDGQMQASGRMRVGYFTQYQVEELASDDTPLEHMTRAMKGSTPGAVRAQLGRFGFSGNRATTLVGSSRAASARGWRWR
jgi:ATP-binding cassette subfamily F protein 3